MARILIAGAGIGGLTAALELARIGADVTIFERASALNEIGAGVQLSPNATRILARLGILDRLSGTHPTGIRVRSGRSGRLLALMPLEDASSRWNAPYIVAHRAELQARLAEAVAASSLITLNVDTTVAGFGVSDGGVRATVKQGTITRSCDGDVLIGADGVHSTIRARLADRGHELRDAGRMAWRALVPAQDLDPLLRVPETNLWLGDNAHLVHYPIDGRRQINVVAITSDRSLDPAVRATWSAAGDPEALRTHFRSWHALARSLIAAAPLWAGWRLFDCNPLPTWNAGRVALLGDAAHPILPFLAQGSAQAIEDAATLAAALASTTDISAGLAAYSRRRSSRVERVQKTSRRLGRIYHLNGPPAMARDLGMRLLGGRRLLDRYDWLYRG